MNMGCCKFTFQLCKGGGSRQYIDATLDRIDGKEIKRDFLEYLAMMIGIMDIFNYKTKSILLREIHKRWLSFFYENKNQVEDYLNYHNPELLVILNNRLQR